MKCMISEARVNFTPIFQSRRSFKSHIRYMGVSKNRDTPKWMVKIMENPIKMDDLGGNTPIFGSTPISYSSLVLQIPCKFDLSRKASIGLGRAGFGTKTCYNIL